MLNTDYKNQVISDLNKINQEYTVIFKKTIADMERLQTTRSQYAVRTIQYMERYILELANKPREYEKKISEVKSRYIKFIDMTKQVQEMEEQTFKKAPTKSLAMAGMFGGASVATLTPTAAMSVAMTFGTASTGTAIASLSGVAATNAALAWLGGGAVVAGGAGMAGGSMLLALAGPVGWVISGTSLLAALATVNMSNKEIAKKTEESIVAIKKEMNRIKEIDVKVVAWNKETKELVNQLTRQLRLLKENHKRDYTKFTQSELAEFRALMNSTEVLSKKLQETIK